MQKVAAQSLTKKDAAWLSDNQAAAKILHLFDTTLNLRSGSGSILSIVAPQVGNGPFSLVLEAAPEGGFGRCCQLDSAIIISTDELRIGNLVIELESAKTWNPRPQWERLRTHRQWLKFLPEFQLEWAPPFPERIDPLYTSLKSQNREAFQMAAANLVGLGEGLTPAGDDFLLGVMIALWSLWPPEKAQNWSQLIVDAAVNRTTSLSFAFLASASVGELYENWHRLILALALEDTAAIQREVHYIKQIGFNSGKAALFGFRTIAQELGNPR